MTKVVEPPPDRRLWHRILFGWVDVREIPWAGLGWVVGAAILYSLLLIFAATPAEFWDWLSTFVATFLSVIAAIFLYRHQSNRAEHERMYRMYLALDADLEVLLTWIDPSRRDVNPLSITLPSGREASAIVVAGDEGRVSMLEETAKAGFETWDGALRNFTLAAAVRGYAAACARFVTLRDTAAIEDANIGPPAEEAILQAAHTVERLREALVEECGTMREALAGWFGRYRHLSPWGPEEGDRRVPKPRGNLFPPPARSQEQRPGVEGDSRRA